MRIPRPPHLFDSRRGPEFGHRCHPATQKISPACIVPLLRHPPVLDVLRDLGMSTNAVSALTRLIRT